MVRGGKIGMIMWEVGAFSEKNPNNLVDSLKLLFFLLTHFFLPLSSYTFSIEVWVFGSWKLL